MKDCSYARLLWAVSPLSNVIIMCNPASFCDWMEFVWSRITGEALDNFVACCWGIWGNRNKVQVVHEHCHYDAQESPFTFRICSLATRKHRCCFLVLGHRIIKCNGSLLIKVTLNLILMPLYMLMGLVWVWELSSVIGKVLLWHENIADFHLFIARRLERL